MGTDNIIISELEAPTFVTDSDKEYETKMEEILTDAPAAVVAEEVPVQQVEATTTSVAEESQLPATDIDKPEDVVGQERARTETPAPPPPEYVPSITEVAMADPDFKVFAEEYPDVAQGVLKPVQMLEAKYNAAIDQMYRLFIPVVQEVQYAKRTAEWDSIRKEHPDVDTLATTGEVKAWIATQSETAQRIYNAIYKEGTPKEVVGMLNEYKAASGKSSGQVSDVNRKKLQSMESVTSRKAPIKTATEGTGYEDTLRDIL